MLALRYWKEVKLRLEKSLKPQKVDIVFGVLCGIDCSRRKRMLATSE